MSDPREPKPDPDLPDPMVRETRPRTERAPYTRREKIAAGVAAGALVVAAAVGVVAANQGPSDQDRLIDVQACLDAGTRQRATLDCVEAAMEGFSPDVASPTLSPSPSPAPVPRCEGTQVAPGQSLVTATNSAPAGTTFCLAAGQHTIASTVMLQGGDVLQGVPCLQDATLAVSCTSAVRWVGGDAAQAMFIGQGHFAVFDLEITGALGNGTCNPDCGRAFRPNQGMTAERIDCHHNENQCIGSGGRDVTVSDSELSYNGTGPEFNAEDARSAGGIKRVRGGSLAITHSYLHDNQWNALWCDFCESTFLVEDNIIVLNDASGIAWEVSGGWNTTDNAIIRGNIIQGNNIGNHRAKSGLTCNGCADLLIENNQFGGNQGTAVHLLDTKRGPWGALTNIVIRNNQLNGDKLIGCSFAGVTCQSNAA